ncbi:DUF4339 domain-containing protein [Roseimicrobium sp. ORNL1]|uniref:DUF4339 domain-containing protein n=1 Tax=Roseimicrobium sp. ORNL1 TaxID=2711231 RepID=UPI0013E16235|nr:DUF4339 domain-containing protein [Roseimicrobium sp. ORNL1]QIF05785.1 DUF4339 domain-containing protein [Roseimicrobium sp. ORNL1]
MAYTIQRQTEKLGPFDLAQVRVMADAGEVSATDLVWVEGTSVPTTVGALLQGVEVAPAPAAAPVFKKGPALTSFFLAAAGLIPGVGLFCAIPAIYFGLKGLKATRAEPQSRERMHAMVGVCVGSFLTLMYLILILAFVMKR